MPLSKVRFVVHRIVCALFICKIIDIRRAHTRLSTKCCAELSASALNIQSSFVSPHCRRDESALLQVARVSQSVGVVPRAACYHRVSIHFTSTECVCAACVFMLRYAARRCVDGWQLVYSSPLRPTHQRTHTHPHPHKQTAHQRTYTRKYILRRIFAKTK